MKAGGQPIAQTLLGVGQIDVGHANLRESKLEGPSLQLGLYIGWHEI
jgi:hypothetical protein